MLLRCLLVSTKMENCSRSALTFQCAPLTRVSLSQFSNLIKQGYYTRLMRLLKELDIALRPDDLTFAFSNIKSKVPYLMYNGLSGMKGLSVPTTTAKVSTFLEIAYYSICYIWLCVVASLHYHLGFWPWIQEITFERFCREFYIGHKFAREVVVPLYSGVCTCKEEDVLQYPAGLVTGISTRVFAVLCVG